MKHTLTVRKRYYRNLRRELRAHGQPIRLPENSRAFGLKRCEWRDGSPVVAQTYADVRVVTPEGRVPRLRPHARTIKSELRALRRELQPSENLNPIALIVALPNEFGQLDIEKVADVVRRAKGAQRPVYEILVVLGLPAHLVEPAKKARRFGLPAEQVVALCDDHPTVLDGVTALVRRVWGAPRREAVSAARRQLASDGKASLALAEQTGELFRELAAA